jgi:hypothetical protein
MVRAIGLVVALSATGLQTQSAEKIDVTGAWTVTITREDGQATGLAILSQDGAKVTGMIGPAETDMMPAGGTVEANTLTLMTHPRTGRTAAFAKCDVIISGDRMSGAIDTDKGKIEFVKRKRSEPKPGH